MEYMSNFPCIFYKHMRIIINVYYINIKYGIICGEFNDCYICVNIDMMYFFFEIGLFVYFL